MYKEKVERRVETNFKHGLKKIFEYLILLRVLGHLIFKMVVEHSISKTIFIKSLSYHFLGIVLEGIS